MKLIIKKDDGTEFEFYIAKSDRQQTLLPGWKITSFTGKSTTEPGVHAQLRVYREAEPEKKNAMPVTNEDLKQDEYADMVDEILTSTVFSWCKGDFIPAMKARLQEGKALTPGMMQAIDKVYNTKFKGRN